MSPLYIVSTPIGNLKDITLRALETLKNVDLILAEDTRQTKKLLSHYDIEKPLESFHEHNEEQKVELVIGRLNEGKSIALVSDAGTPLISDPGFKLVRTLIEKGFRVEPIPGPSSLLAAITGSGLPTDQFLFIGYLPKKTSKLNRIFDFIDLVTSKKATTVIFFESPYRLKSTLTKLAERFPKKEVVVARELTKLHEEFIRGRASDISKKGITAKGEVTVLLR